MQITTEMVSRLKQDGFKQGDIDLIEFLNPYQMNLYIEMMTRIRYLYPEGEIVVSRDDPYNHVHIPDHPHRIFGLNPKKKYNRIHITLWTKGRVDGDVAELQEILGDIKVTSTRDGMCWIPFCNMEEIDLIIEAIKFSIEQYASHRKSHNNVEYVRILDDETSMARTIVDNSTSILDESFSDLELMARMDAIANSTIVEGYIIETPSPVGSTKKRRARDPRVREYHVCDALRTKSLPPCGICEKDLVATSGGGDLRLAIASCQVDHINRIENGPRITVIEADTRWLCGDCHNALNSGQYTEDEIRRTKKGRAA